MNILLVNPPTLNRGKPLKDLSRAEQEGTALPYYKTLLAMDVSKRHGFSTLPGEHLGLQSLQAALESAGHNTCVLNACVELHTSLQQTFSRIREYHFDLVGFSGPLDVFSENLWLARTLREAGYTGHITLGHDFATLNHQTLLNLCPEFDSIVRGEGEVTICELADALEQNRSLGHVQGLSFHGQTGVIINPPRSVVADLDLFPWVTRYDLPSVLGLGMSASIFTKRGCPYQCAFCTTGAVPFAEGYRGRERWRQRRASRIVDEMEFLVKEFHAPWLTLVDDLYLSKGAQGSQQALEVADELMSRRLDINYMIDCRVDSVDKEVFKILQRSGLRKVFIGVESASQVVLDSFRKGYKPALIRDKLRILEELGIEFILGYIFFSPLDTLEGLEQSYRLVLDLNQRDFALFLQEVRIYPGTPLHRDLERCGLLVGEFPYFSANYMDPYVNRLREMLRDFAGVAIPILRASYIRNNHEAVLGHGQMYVLVSTSLGEMIECCKRGDDGGLEAIYNAMLDQFNQLVRNSID